MDFESAYCSTVLLALNLVLPCRSLTKNAKSPTAPADGLPQLKASLFDLAMLQSGDYESPVNPDGLMKQGSGTLSKQTSRSQDGNRGEADTGTSDSEGKGTEAGGGEGEIKTPDGKKQISSILEEAGDETPLIGTGSVDSAPLPGEHPG